jgi:hypothetical protein
LPANGSELVLFDVNTEADLQPMLRPSIAGRLATMLPPRRRAYRITVISNASPDSRAAIERTTPAGATAATARDIGLAFPAQIFSLSHIAMPFPESDGLYGASPAPGDDFGISLGTLAARGERGVLSLSLDTLLRLSWNPFFGYLADRIAPAAAPIPTPLPSPPRGDQGRRG